MKRYLLITIISTLCTFMMFEVNLAQAQEEARGQLRQCIVHGRVMQSLGSERARIEILKAVQFDGQNLTTKRCFSSKSKQIVTVPTKFVVNTGEVIRLNYLYTTEPTLTFKDGAREIWQHIPEIRYRKPGEDYKRHDNFVTPY